MLSMQCQHDLLLKARDLAQPLVQGGVTRSEIRPVLNALFLSTGAWADRLKQAQALLEQLPESWVGNRSNNARERHARVRSAFRPLFREPLPAEEMRFLLGWVTRLVHTADLAARREAKRQAR
jgi:hypothetical protein